MSKNYIDNKKMYEELALYNKMVKNAKRKKEQKPRLPEYIGQCFLLLASNLANLPQFSKYPFREDMEGDAYENCLIYVDNFDSDKYKNPFAYFTQIMYYAFLRRIYKEKKQLYIKHKALERSMILNQLADYQGEDAENLGDIFNTIDNSKMNDLVDTFEKNLLKKKTKRKAAGIEAILEEDEEEERDMSERDE